MGNEVNYKTTSIRILVDNVEEKERIVKALNTIFNIISCSKMFKANKDKKNKDKTGYYIYLEVQYKSNSRNAGRKEKFNEREKNMMKMYRYQNKTIREIAKMFNCSAGTVHKIVK